MRARIAILLLAVLAIIGAPPRAMARAVCSEKTASGVFAADYATHARQETTQVLDRVPETTPRDYEFASGRPKWPSRDPIGEEGGLNLYGILLNNALNLWDYLGLNDFEHINGGLRDAGNMDIYMGLRYKGNQRNLVVETTVHVAWKPCPGYNAEAGSKTYGPIYSNLDAKSQQFKVDGINYPQITPIHTEPNNNQTGTANWIDSLMYESAANRYCTDGTITITIRYTSKSDPATPGLTGDNRNVFRNEAQHNTTGEKRPSNFDQGNPTTKTIKIKWNCKGEMSMESELPAGPNRDEKESKGTTIPPQRPAP